jgi:hypothetical protein
MTKIFTPSSGPEDWKALLADPEKQWVRGFSARTLAHAWEDTVGFPREIIAVFKQHPELEGIEPLIIFPEWKVPLPGGGAASQNDVWVLAKCHSGLVSMAIEGKVEEPFGQVVGEWKAGASKGKLIRLAYLTEVLGLALPIPDKVYYQLLHRAASAVIEAERFGATHAVMLIYSFSPTHRWLEAFKDFAALFNTSVEIGTLATVKVRKNFPLHLAWVHGDERFLNA